MEQVTHEDLSLILPQYYDKRIALFVMGRFGIGKSGVINDVAQKLAEKKQKKYVSWNKISKEEKIKVYNNPKDYFVMVDIRLSEYDSSDIKGLPMFMKAQAENDIPIEAIEFKVPFWALLMTKKESAGVLFFDEINLSPPLVMSSCYKILYDRIINDMAIEGEWGIIGAGNLDEDRAYTNSMSPPLKDRAGEVELVGAGVEKWTGWAIEHGVDTRIIGFLNFKQLALYKVDFNDKQKFTTHRGWERVSTLTKGVEDFKVMELLSCSAIGEGIAKEYVAWCKISQQIDLPSIIANPEKIKQIEEISIKWFINTAVAEQYANGKIKFDRVMALTKVLDEIDNVELVAYLWKLCFGLTTNFRKEFLKTLDDDLVKKYTKYLIY
jgi:hypothetical protein